MSRLYTIIIRQKISCGKFACYILYTCRFFLAYSLTLQLCNFRLFTHCHCLGHLDSWDFISRCDMAKRSVMHFNFTIAFSKEWWVKFLIEWAQVVVLNYKNERVASMKSVISFTDVAVIFNQILPHHFQTSE